MSSREEFECPTCGRKAWYFAANLGTPCTHCGAPLGGLSSVAVPTGDVDLLEGLLEARPVDMASVNRTARVIELVPGTLARECRIVPISADRDSLTIAAPDDIPIETMYRIQFVLNRRINVRTAPAAEIDKAIDRFYPD